MFAHYANLAQFLADKAELGCAVRFAYAAGRNDLIRECMDRVSRLLEQMPALTGTWRELWMSTSKAVGFEAINVRMGALEIQLKYALESLKGFCERGAYIEELEMEPLYFSSLRPVDEERALNVANSYWERIVCANPIDM